MALPGSDPIEMAAVTGGEREYLDGLKPSARLTLTKRPVAWRVYADDIFQPIVGLSTTDKKVVELLVGDRTMTGYFYNGRWMAQRFHSGLKQ